MSTIECLAPQEIRPIEQNSLTWLRKTFAQSPNGPVPSLYLKGVAFTSLILTSIHQSIFLFSARNSIRRMKREGWQHGRSSLIGLCPINLERDPSSTGWTHTRLQAYSPKCHQSQQTTLSSWVGWESLLYRVPPVSWPETHEQDQGSSEAEVEQCHLEPSVNHLGGSWWRTWR